MSSANEKQKYVLKIQGIKSAISFLLMLLGWLAFSRLLHMPETEALLLTIALTILLELKFLLQHSETVRRMLLNLPTLDQDPITNQFSKSTNRYLTYIAGALVILTLLSFLLLRVVKAPILRHIVSAIFPLAIMLVVPILQLVQYWEASKLVDVINPSPIRFVLLIAPASILSFLCSLFLCAGIIASIILGNPLYLVPGTVCAVFLFIFARNSAKRLVSKYAVELPN